MFDLQSPIRCWSLTLRGAVATAVLAGLAATTLAQAQTETPKRGGTLNIGVEADPASLDPLRLGSYVERQYAMAVFDTLLDIDASGKLVPSLATAYEISPDGRAYTLKLRQGVTFHDGTPFDADAVVYNLDRVRDPVNNCRCLANISSVESVKAVDTHTVVVRLKAPSVAFAALLADTAAMMASPKALKADPVGFGNVPVGTGAFKLVEWVKGSRFVGERNPNYWRQGQPYADRLIYRGLQSNETRESTFQSGALDILTQASPKFVAAAKKDRRFKVLEPDGFGSIFIALRTKHPALADIRVRKAIAHATQRELLVKAVYQGMYKVATTPFGEGLPGLSPVTDYPAYDLDKAKALLAEYGQAVELRLMMDNTPIALQAAQALQQMWQRAGIKVTLTPVDQARLVQNMLTHEFDTTLFRWSGRPDPDLNTYTFFHSSNAEKKISSNYIQYANPEMDRLLDAGRMEMDPSKRNQIYNQISQLLAKDLPYVFLAYITAPIVTTQAVRGVELVPDSLIRVGAVWKE
ncbi:ABC transporter substrate-binding protein [Verminephrobacter eiseniae]|uniref:ABC transporter substrate-binding protein n=1 Tax=Verminephrobacter eiseniae TaxID=364317 RepID=UPI0010CE1B2A|nr:ABC transporter substrate-binding protein [Verminephrobacter eiseniae]KAB7578677.1 hypothetical protein ET532_018155 [Verminephrobacter sp. Larva24]MCW5231011.1 hypothetical protein [Verminephrobacter eiseniae]MCW5292744.1 hypothetical protein [Verminephrobacter eiseniae]MCW8184637.1 hypothetical protein [Verminephrobacter eiseniae]MCW8223313.1 hypothetical protein [Verminephrobacter eiseniae]